MRPRFAFLLLVSSFFVVRTSQANDLAKEKENLQGTWAVVSLVDSGHQESKDDIKLLKLAIKGDKYTYSMAGRSFSAAYWIDPDKNPKEMDVTFKEGPQKGKTMLAIYSLTGDELKICGGDKRPAEFSSKAKSETVLFVFEREKP